MVAATSIPEVTVIGVNQLEQREKRRRRSNEKNTVSDDSTCASESSQSTATKPRRRRRRTKKNKNISQQQLNKDNEVILSLEDQMKYIAMDCEMVGVGYKGKKSSVARVTLVGWNGETIFDEFVKQSTEVVDYRTFVSGITEVDLEGVKLTLEECRAQVQKILEGKVLVGHALKNDMNVLSITHPWYMTRDTAKYEPFMQVRFNDGILWPRKLKELTKNKLSRDIQVYGKPHCSYEDALAALDLFKKHMKKWEKVMEYKFNKSQKFQSQQISEQGIANE